MSNNSYMSKLYNNVNSKKVSNISKKNAITSKIMGTVIAKFNIIGIVLITLAMVIAVYYFTRQISKNDKLNPTLVPKTVKMDELGKYDAPLPLNDDGVLHIGNGVSLSYSLWVYVSDWSTGSDENTIFRRGNRNRDMQNESAIKINYKSNSLVVKTRVAKGVCDSHEFYIAGFPLQKWNHIAYVLNGTFIDLYLNGKLRKSNLFRNGEGTTLAVHCEHGDKATDKIYINNSDAFSGHMSKFRYFSRAILPTDVIDLYNDGPL